MIRNLKALGLAAIAVFAMSAMGATAAQASNEPLTITPAEYPAVLTSTALSAQTFQVGSAVLTCNELFGHSTIEKKGAGDTEVTFTDIRYKDCSAQLGETKLPVTVDMTGCDYRFTGGEQSATNEHYFENGTVTLDCPEGVTGPDIYIYQNAEHKTKVCTYTVWEFTDHGNITYENVTGGTDDVELHAINVPVPVTRSQGLLCPKPAEEAKYNGEVTVKAYKDLGGEPTPTEGSQIGVTVSEGL